MEGLAWRLLKVSWLMPPSRHQAVMFTVARLSRGLLGQRIGAEPAKHRDWRIGGGGWRRGGVGCGCGCGCGGTHPQHTAKKEIESERRRRRRMGSN